MVDRTEYTVLRFVERNGYCFMTNDTVKGSSVMQCVLKDKTVPKQQIFKWLIQIAHQIEQYYKCEKERAYGCMSPYAVIVVGADMVSLLDPMEAENYELIKRMQKKKVRALFVRKEHALSQRTDRVDDLYGFGKTMEFMLDKCCSEKKFTRKEEKVMRRVRQKCENGEDVGLRAWVNIQRELYVLEEIQNQKREPFRKTFMGVAAALVLTLAGMNVFQQRTESRKFKEAEVVQAGERKEEVSDTVTDTGEIQTCMELGLMYFMEFEDYEVCREVLEKAGEQSALAKDYLEIIQYLKKGGSENDVKRGLEQVLEHGKRELESIAEKEIYGKEFLYKMPLIQGYRMLNTEDAWREVKRIGEEMLNGMEWNYWKEAGNREKELRLCLAESYERLEETDKAVEQYEKLIELEYDAVKLETIQLKLEGLYEKKMP